MRLIDADDLRLHIQRYGIMLGDEDATDEERERYLLRVIEKQPTIDPESFRPKGRWVHDKYHQPYCSNCGALPPMDCEGESFYDSDYCPECGAKMEV